MPAAYNGKILHVDLSDGRTWVEEPDELIYRKYLGGSAMASHFMLRDIPVGADQQRRADLDHEAAIRSNVEAGHGQADR